MSEEVAKVPLSPPAPGRPAREGDIERSCRVGTNSETTYIPTPIQSILRQRRYIFHLVHANEHENDRLLYNVFLGTIDDSWMV